jgi:hypothetical protein
MLKAPHRLNAVSSDLCHEDRPGPVPPESTSFMGDVDAAIMRGFSAFCSESGWRTYIITVRRMISDPVSKQRSLRGVAHAPKG